jgi:hypothetical protein
MSWFSSVADIVAIAADAVGGDGQSNDDIII